MDDGFRWRLLLRAEPNRVFCLLVRAASEDGRVCGVGEYGTVLTYTPTRRALDLVGQMRATVRPCPEGALIIIEPVDHRANSASALAVQAQSVASLMHQLRRHYAVESSATVAQG